MISVLGLRRELLDSPAPCANADQFPLSGFGAARSIHATVLSFEWAKGLDSSLSIVWDALFSWQKI